MRANLLLAVEGEAGQCGEPGEPGEPGAAGASLCVSWASGRQLRPSASPLVGTLDFFMFHEHQSKKREVR